MNHEFYQADNYGITAICYCRTEPLYSSPEGATADELVLDHEPVAEAIVQEHEGKWNHVVYMLHGGPSYGA